MMRKDVTGTAGQSPASPGGPYVQTHRASSRSKASITKDRSLSPKMTSVVGQNEQISRSGDRRGR